MNIVYTNIKAIRESKKLRQEDMADKLNMAKNSYSLLERAEISLTVERLEKIAQIFKMNPVEIYDYHLKESKEKNVNEKNSLDIRFKKFWIYHNLQEQINRAVKDNLAPICFAYNEELDSTMMRFAPLKDKISEEDFKNLLLFQSEYKFLKLEDSAVKFVDEFDKKYNKKKK